MEKLQESLPNENEGNVREALPYEHSQDKVGEFNLPVKDSCPYNIWQYGKKTKYCKEECCESPCSRLDIFFSSLG